MQDETSCSGGGWKGNNLSHAACGVIVGTWIALREIFVRERARMRKRKEIKWKFPIIFMSLPLSKAASNTLGISGFAPASPRITSPAREGGECSHTLYVSFWVRSASEGEHFDWVVGKWKHKLMQRPVKPKKIYPSALQRTRRKEQTKIAWQAEKCHWSSPDRF